MLYDAAWWIEGHAGLPVDATVIATIVLLNGVRVPSSELVRGDILLLAEGDAIGADARLVEAAALHVQEASLTGESEPVLKDSAQLEAEPPVFGRRPDSPSAGLTS